MILGIRMKNVTINMFIILILIVINEFVLVYFDPSPPLDKSSLIFIRFFNCLLLAIFFFNYFNLFSIRKLTRVFPILSVLMVSLLTLVGIETFIAYFAPNSVQLDNTLGWKLKSNFSKKVLRTRMDGTQHLVLFETDAEGFRTYGNSAYSSKRILVLGDSYTGSSFASNDQMWYSVMVKEIIAKTKIPSDYIDVKAGGAGGYGSYQNYLLASKYKDTLKPDLFILQFCINDFADDFFVNSEMVGPVSILTLNRPNWNAANQTSVFPKTNLSFIYRSFIAETKIFQSIEAVILQFYNKLYFGQSDYLNTNHSNKNLETVRLKIMNTETILKKLRGLFPDVPALMINCSSLESLPNKYWKEVAVNSGFIPISAPSDVLMRQFKLGRQDLFNFDRGHFSDIGNILYGKTLSKELLKMPDIINLLTKP